MYFFTAVRFAVTARLRHCGAIDSGIDRKINDVEHYGTLLCVSDKPLHGEIKLPGTASAIYQRAVGEHLSVGIAALDLLRGDLGAPHSRKLRSFDEPPFC